MQLRTISASGFSVARLCLARYEAEYIKRTPKTESAEAAWLGSAVHGALEDYVQLIYIKKDVSVEPSYDTLLALFNKHFAIEFNTASRTSHWYKQGVEMISRWHDRTDLSSVEVISTEVRSSIKIKTSQGVKSFNYVWDRCDRFMVDGKKCIRVVDYKTWRKNMYSKDMENNPQVRMYALAAAIQFRDENPDEIWVQLDQLRYGDPEIEFTREDNVETWNEVRRQAELIIQAPSNPEARLNPECGYCAIKATCKKLTENINGGGVWSLVTADERLARLRELQNQSRAIDAATKELEMIIEATIVQSDEGKVEGEKLTGEFSTKTRRVPRKREIEAAIGQRVNKPSVASVDKLLKSGDITQDQAEKLRKSFGHSASTSIVVKDK